MSLEFNFFEKNLLCLPLKNGWENNKAIACQTQALAAKNRDFKEPQVPLVNQIFEARFCLNKTSKTFQQNTFFTSRKRSNGLSYSCGKNKRTQLKDFTQ